MHGTSGSFSRQITFKNYNGRTVIAHYPDMSKVIYTKAQIAERFRFKLAVAYARAIIADPIKKKAYSRKKHSSAYHAAIAEYIHSSKAEENSQINISPISDHKATSIKNQPHDSPAPKATTDISTSFSKDYPPS